MYVWCVRARARVCITFLFYISVLSLVSKSSPIFYNKLYFIRRKRRAGIRNTYKYNMCFDCFHLITAPGVCKIKNITFTHTRVGT